jgi:ABC-type Fe3+/spermidine/putrescine transport system ATPase subunit
VIGLDGLCVRGGRFVVGPVDLQLAVGDYCGLVGPSGAGKTLLLEAVAGLRSPTAGRVLIDGQDLTSAPPERRGVGLVFQDGLLFPHLTVAGNISYGLRRRAAASLDALVRGLGVEDLMRRSPGSLSGGERQRVALARALAPGPRVLLLDEPLSSVDGEAREELREILHRVTCERGVTVLHVTHDVGEMFSLEHTCAVLVGGRLRQVGAPSDVLRRPIDEDVARLFGARNVLRAARAPEGDGRTLLLEGGSPVHVGEPVHAAEVLVVVRPEDVTLVLPGGAVAGGVGGAVDASGSNVLSGRVERVVSHGGHSLLRVMVPPAIEVSVSSREVGRLQLEAGAEVELRFSPQMIWVLPAQG